MIVGIDPGTKNVGSCQLFNITAISAKSGPLWNKRNPNDVEMAKELREWLDEFALVGCKKIVIESQMRALFKRFVAQVVMWGEKSGVQVKVVSPVTIKRHFGIPCRRNHFLNKKEVVAKVKELRGDDAYTDHNMCDAYLLAKYGEYLVKEGKWL